MTELYKCPETLYHFYWVEEMTTSEMGELFDCSQTTIRDWMNKHMIERRSRSDRTGKNAPNWKGATKKITCKNCGSVFKDYISNNRKFCSQECSFDYNTGKNHHRWKEGWDENIYDSRKYRKNRKRCFARDGYKCQVCDMDMEDHYDKYGRSLECHHIIPVRKFDNREDAHELDNLETLCKEHHNEKERKIE